MDKNLLTRGLTVVFAGQVIVAIVIGVLFALAWSNQTVVGW